MVWRTVQGQWHCLSFTVRNERYFEFKNSSTLNRVTLCSCKTVGYRATCNEAADGVLETPGLEFMKNGVYIVSNAWIFEVVAKKGREWSPYSREETQFFRKGFEFSIYCNCMRVCVCVWVCVICLYVWNLQFIQVRRRNPLTYSKQFMHERI